MTGILLAADLPKLLEILHAQKYEVMGPRVDNHTIVYGPIESIEDLPQGYEDQQTPGHYRLTKNNSPRYFHYNIGAHSWKQFLFPPHETLQTTKRQAHHIQVIQVKPPAVKRAFIGMRSCELEAIRIQDKVFSQNYVDEYYQQRRAQALFIAVNCSKSSETCFCTSMQTGPEVMNAYDLLLTEIIDKNQHYFIVEYGSPKGEAIYQILPLKPCESSHLSQKQKSIQGVIKTISKSLDTHNIKQILYDKHQAHHWDNVADACVNCGNCTMACPTCFCSTTTEQASLDAQQSTKIRQWDSCFSQAFTYVHDSFVRGSAQSRYRQWMTHKLASWQDQFDTSGCVGCGRCITWCPVGIDLTEEYKHIKEST